ncbi:hypothetical protein Tco_0859096 [Tanacetum coccineum]|uniref:Uncharacterized protein n=1 Tax=Tanacetum coccineum TaxID=301880 RepID=A0ABQ5BGN8_9ASTR
MIAPGLSRYSLNDMVHNHYLEEAKKKTQESCRISEPSVMPSLLDHKAQQMVANQNLRSITKSLGKGLYSKSVASRTITGPKQNTLCILINSRAKVPSHKTTTRYKPVEQTSFAKKPERQIPKRHRSSIKKTSVVHEKTMTPRSCLRWKPTGKIFKTVGLRWVPTGKIFTSSTTKVDSEPTNGSNDDITNQYECKQTLDVSAGLNPQCQMTSVHNSSGLNPQCQMMSVHNSSGLNPQCQMTSVHNSSGLKPQCQMTFEQNGSSLARQCQQKFIKQLRQIRRRCCSLIPAKSNSCWARAQVDQGSQIKIIQVKEMMQDNDLKNSKSKKNKGSRSRSQSMNEQSHYKQDQTKTRQSINVKSHIFNVREDNDKSKQTPSRMSSVVRRSLKKETSTLGEIVSLNCIKSNKNVIGLRKSN